MNIYTHTHTHFKVATDYTLTHFYKKRNTYGETKQFHQLGQILVVLPIYKKDDDITKKWRNQQHFVVVI